MEKATAELDGTIVFNYIDDDVQIIEAEEQPSNEPKSDTSFDENQNPKEKVEDSVVEELIKQDKDLIILLENEVLRAIKPEPPEENISSQPQNSTRDVEKNVRRKRARSSESTKPPKTKKLKISLKTKGTLVKKLKDPIRNKLEDTKPKRGRPKKVVPPVKGKKTTIPKIKIKLKKHKTIKKGLKVNKKVVPKIIIKLKHISPKRTRKGIIAKKQYAVMNTNGAESSKPKRGRPKKQITPETKAESKNINKQNLCIKQDATITVKDVTIEEAKKSKSKHLITSYFDSSQATESIKLNISNKLMSRGMELKRENDSVKIAASRPSNMNGSTLETKLGNSTIRSADLLPPKPKRGRPVGSGRKSVDISLKSDAVICSKVKESQNTGIDQQRTVASADITKLLPSETLERTLIDGKQPATVQTRGVWPSKPKNSRSNSLEVKKADVPMLSNAIESSTSGELENNISEPKKLDVLGNLTESQISVISELMMQAEQQIAIIENPPKKDKVKGFGRKKRVVETVEPNQLEAVVDLTKTQPSEIIKPCLQAASMADAKGKQIPKTTQMRNKREKQQTSAVGDLALLQAKKDRESKSLEPAASVESKDLKLPNSIKGKQIASGPKNVTKTVKLNLVHPFVADKSRKLNTSLDLTTPTLQRSNSKNTRPGTEQQRPTMKSKPKQGRPKSLGSKEVDVSVVSQPVEPSNAGRFASSDVAKQLDVSLNLTNSQLSRKEGGNLEVGKNTAPSKPKRGRHKSLEAKKVGTSVVSKPDKFLGIRELNNTGMELKQQDALVDLTRSLPSNSKEASLQVQQQTAHKQSMLLLARPKGLETKKLGFVAPKVNKCANTAMSSRHLDALMNFSKLQLSKIRQTNLKAKQQNESVESNDLLPSKRKRGRPKGFKLKKHIPTIDTELRASNSGKSDINLINRQLNSSLVINDVGKDLNSSKTLTLKALGLEARQEAMSSHSLSSRSLRAKVLTPKKLTLPHAEASKTKKTPVGMKTVNTSAEQNGVDPDIKPDVIKLTKNLKTSKRLPKLVVAVRKVNVGLPKRKRGRPKSSLAQKINPLSLMVRLEPLKLEEIEFTDAGPSTSVTTTYLGSAHSNMIRKKANIVNQAHLPKCKEIAIKGTGRTTYKKVKDTNVEAMQIPKATQMRNKREKQKTSAVGDLALLQAKKDKESKSLEPAKDIFCNPAQGLKLSKPKDTSNKSVRMTKSQEPGGMDLGAKKNDGIIEIVDLQSPPVRHKSFKARTAALEPQPSTSTGIVETIDLELAIPKNINKMANRNLDPEVSGKRKRRDISFCEGNRDFIFPKPKRICKRVFATNDKSSKPEETVAKTVEQKRDNPVGSEVVEPSKPEEILPKIEELKDGASVETKEEPSKLLEAAVPSVSKKVMCTVGTQTIEIPDDDDIKTLDTKSSVDTVGTQILESSKPKEDKDKDTTESALPKADKNSDTEEKTEKVDEVKTEEDGITATDIQPTVTINLTEGNQDQGVKFETVEQIHTEFKYESQSEHEDLRRRRGKLGGPMRGRRRRPKEEPTSINSFVRIIDLNGKIQLKCYKQIYKCDHCLYVGNSKANLDRHSLVHRSPDEIIWFQCSECPYRSKYEHQLKSHFLIHLKPEQIHFFQCPHCEAKCSRKHNLANHIRSIHSSREYTFRCAECDYTTFSKERLVAHLRKHSKEVHACTHCKFVTKRLEYLRSHFKIKHLLNALPRPFPCDTCSYKGKTKRELDKHFDRMHNKDRLHVYQCNHCAFNSIYKKNLEFHLLHMHNNSEGFQKFICGHCQKTFSYKNGLKVHIIRCHLQLPDEEWHKCLECKYKSKDVSTLKRHIKRNHGAPRLHCKLCGFATNRQVSMDAHLKTHEYDNEDILKCPECPYRILQMSSFLYHMKVIHGKPVTSKEAEQYYMQDEC